MQRSQACMADDVNQRHVAEAQSNFDNDDADLNQRRKCETAFNVGLHPRCHRGKDHRNQPQSDHHDSQRQRFIE